ncbi:MAG TPA: class II glutamine amidotransferase [Microbacterium sp.]|nr:class II glutamine amidotransferase [Microbacterium sp.]
MCRLVAFASPVPRTLREVMGAAQLSRFAGLAGLHADGWGAEWVAAPGGAVRTRRELQGARHASGFRHLTDAQAAVAMGVHLRLASIGGATDEANNHPFTRDGIALMHNGTIEPRARLEAMLAPETLATMSGATDSERYLALVAALRPGFETLTDAVAEAVARLRSAFPTASLNAVILDGRELVAVHANTAPLSPAEVEDMRVASGADGLPDGHEACYYQMYARTDADGTVVFASSGLGQDGWTALPAESLTTVELATGSVALTALRVAA